MCDLHISIKETVNLISINGQFPSQLPLEQKMSINGQLMSINVNQCQSINVNQSQSMSINSQKVNIKQCSIFVAVTTGAENVHGRPHLHIFQAGLNS